ncbi:unnamed protein product [Fusarium venenatum]|uniref:Uncharacterized protein n=1 Tax=Fusarium venenatum TaxID=56646 RepID=A0A2L2TKM7_9HYPO|nr:uncharacterized protein FVRRES_10785 [Fusarium venenatum]CEI70708.1 unnamed protein product [Fusarium venenatum]
MYPTSIPTSPRPSPPPSPPSSPPVSPIKNKQVYFLSADPADPNIHIHECASSATSATASAKSKWRLYSDQRSHLWSKMVG